MRPLVPEHLRTLRPYRPGKPPEELQRELGITNAIKLASNENPSGPSPRALEAARAALPQVHRYPDAACHLLRRDLAAFHGVTPEEIAVGNGSNELIDLCFRTFAAADDAHAVFGMPSFVCYRQSAVAHGVSYTEVPLRDLRDWDVDDLLAAMRPETALLMIATPNNPTAAHLSAADLERLLRETPESVVVVVDEAYFEYVDAADFTSAVDLRTLRERLMVLRTFSKAHGLAGLRIGYGVAPAALVDPIDRVRPPFNAGAIGQAAARAALEDREHVRASVALNRVERARLTAALGALGLEVAPSQANFLLVGLGRPAAPVFDALLHLGVIVRPLDPPLDRHLRITVGLPTENDRLLTSLAEVLGG